MKRVLQIAVFSLLTLAVTAGGLEAQSPAQYNNGRGQNGWHDNQNRSRNNPQYRENNNRGWHEVQDRGRVPDVRYNDRNRVQSRGQYPPYRDYNNGRVYRAPAPVVYTQAPVYYGNGYPNDGYYAEGPGYYDDGYYQTSRPAGQSVAIVAGSAAAGAVIGAAAGHGQGAAIGAVIGGITGLIVDQATRNGRY